MRKERGCVSDFTRNARPALAGVPATGRHGRSDGPAGLVVRERVDLSLASVIARKGEVDALRSLAKRAYGLDLPLAPRRVSTLLADARHMAFAWAGPAQWLATRDGLDELETELVAALGTRAMIAEQGDGRCVLRVSGPNARQVLAKGLPIDLDPRVFKPGDVALSVAAHVNAHLWQLDDAPTYEMSVMRSFAGSFWSWLEASAAEFGYEVADPRT
jgi:methylglutamate dehydrogenase subunit D